MKNTLFQLVSTLPWDLKNIASKVIEGQRISPHEGLILYQKAELGFLGTLANWVRTQKNGDYVYFNRNFHIEPTNICIYKCNFCSFVHKIGENQAWEYSLEQILEKVRQYQNSKVTEVHIVGGVHPDKDVHYYAKMLKSIKEIMPTIHIKAFTAIELDFMIQKAGLSLVDGLNLLKTNGLDSLPGGGAEIFDTEIRQQICSKKSDANLWLTIHQTAHELGIPSNATMLYGHIESYQHRIDHLERLRHLQDKTKGFNTFIPLKYRKANNQLSAIGELTTIEDLRNYAISRIYLDNFQHIKAYWVMIGRETAQLSLNFGVDDLDGTIDDSTKIYTMAGADETSPTMNTEQLVQLIKNANRIPVERDTLYKVIQKF